MAGKRVRVDPRVPGQLVRAGEALEAPGEVALVGLFARVCSDVAGLVLEPVERLLAQRTLVGPGLRRRRRRRAAAGRRGGLGVVCSGHAGCAAGLLWGRGCSAAGALADGPGQHAKRGTLLAADCFWVSPGTHGGLCTPPAVHRHHHPVFWIPRASSQARCNRHNPTLRKRLALPLPLAFSRPRLPLVFSPGARNEEKGGGGKRARVSAVLRKLYPGETFCRGKTPRPRTRAPFPRIYTAVGGATRRSRSPGPGVLPPGTPFPAHIRKHPCTEV